MPLGVLYGAQRPVAALLALSTGDVCYSLWWQHVCWCGYKHAQHHQSQITTAKPLLSTKFCCVLLPALLLRCCYVLLLQWVVAVASDPSMQPTDWQEAFGTLISNALQETAV